MLFFEEFCRNRQNNGILHKKSLRTRSDLVFCMTPELRTTGKNYIFCGVGCIYGSPHEYHVGKNITEVWQYAGKNHT